MSYVKFLNGFLVLKFNWKSVACLICIHTVLFTFQVENCTDFTADTILGAVIFDKCYYTQFLSERTPLNERKWALVSI